MKHKSMYQCFLTCGTSNYENESYRFHWRVCMKQRNSCRTLKAGDYLSSTSNRQVRLLRVRKASDHYTCWHNECIFVPFNRLDCQTHSVSHNGLTGIYAVSQRISNFFVSIEMTCPYQFATDCAV